MLMQKKNNLGSQHFHNEANVPRGTFSNSRFGLRAEFQKKDVKTSFLRNAAFSGQKIIDGKATRPLGKINTALQNKVVSDKLSFQRGTKDVFSGKMPKTVQIISEKNKEGNKLSNDTKPINKMVNNSRLAGNNNPLYKQLLEKYLKSKEKEKEKEKDMFNKLIINDNLAIKKKVTDENVVKKTFPIANKFAEDNRIKNRNRVLNVERDNRISNRNENSSYIEGNRRINPNGVSSSTQDKNAGVTPRVKELIAIIRKEREKNERTKTNKQN